MINWIKTRFHQFQEDLQLKGNAACKLALHLGELWEFMREPHAKGDASAFSRKNQRVCLQVKGNEEPLQGFLLSCKVKAEYNSQVVFFPCTFKVNDSVLQLILQCDGFKCINSIGVSQPLKHPTLPINSICQRFKLYTNIQCTVRREAILGRTLPD